MTSEYQVEKECIAITTFLRLKFGNGFGKQSWVDYRDEHKKRNLEVIYLNLALKGSFIIVFCLPFLVRSQTKP